ncbi:MAG TPA: DNA repair exonuclease [Spirochaetota bacterium]|nr:DNA repair exonuclease [Spirochaetota bacterium]
MVRILLTSDLHLGGNGNQPVRQPERLITLKKIITLAKNHDLLLIAGDLFDSPSPPEELVSEVSSLFGILRKKGAHILITPGETEYVNDTVPDFMRRLGADMVFSDNDSDPFVFDHEGQKIFVYGLPHSSRDNLSRLKKKEESGFHVGLFHTLVDDTSTSSETLRVEDLKSRTLDFYALGHNHNFKLYKYMDTIVGAYPGSPEGSGSDETGDRYVLSLTVEDNELTQIKRLTVNTIRIASKTVDCAETDCDSLFSILSTMQDPKCCAIITLTGRRPYLIPEDRLSGMREKFYDIVIMDESHLSLQSLADEYAGEKSLRGDYFRRIADSIRSGTIPADTDLNKLADLLSRIAKDDQATEEETLCALLNA